MEGCGIAGIGSCAAGWKYGEYEDGGSLPDDGDHWDHGPDVEGVRILGDVIAAAEDE